MATYAEVLVNYLQKMGVKRVYGIVGDSLNPIVDAIARTDIQWVHVRNEEAAAFAAGADSLVSGTLGVCAASCGPGNTHFIQGLMDSHRNGAKVLAIASHIPAAQIGSQFFQETRPEELFRQASGYCETVYTADQGARITHQAIQSTMSGHGVSVLVIPGDISREEVSDNRFYASDIAVHTPIVYPAPEEAAKLVHAINEARTVTLFCGAGCEGARDEVFQLAEKVKAPIGHALGGKMIIQHDNPYDVGMSGLLGYGACHDACDKADLLILLGTDFPYDDFLPTKNVAQVDINGAHLGRRTTVKYPVVGDVRTTLLNILPHVHEKSDRTFLDKMLKSHYDKLTGIVDAYTKGVEKMTPIHPEFVADTLDELAAHDAVFTVDTGMCNVWAARYINNPTGKRTLLGSFRHGTMANALPQAIGAQAANPKRQVISMSGDGGLGMLLGELLTVKLHNLPIKIVVFNNSSLGMVKLEMLVQGLREHETDHAAVDFDAIATGVGIKHIRIEDPTTIRSRLADALAYPGPVLVDVVTDPNALSIPPNITWEMLLGFSKAATRTVLGGGVGRMVDLARANMRNVAPSVKNL